MSTFTQRIYLTWLAGHGGLGASRRAGYGAQPHAERREGYPTGQAKQPETCRAPGSSWLRPAAGVTSRKGSQRAKDAASRPEKQPAGVPATSPLFLHQPEKSSGR